MRQTGLLATTAVVAPLAGILAMSAFGQTPAPAVSNRDKAFNPQAQHAVVEGVSVQHPRAQLMGVLPVTAGPSVPLVTLDGASLLAIPGERWITALYATNNSGATVNTVVVACSRMPAARSRIRV